MAGKGKGVHSPKPSGTKKPDHRPMLIHQPVAEKNTPPVNKGKSNGRY